MLITSKFSGTCLVCHKLVQPGDRVSWTRGVRGVSHAACSGEGKALAPKLAASRAAELTSDVVLSVPEGLDYLGYQRAGIAYALDHKGTLIADEMGLGKTVQAIGIINNSPDVTRVCVVCPASLKLNWKRELTKWLTRPLHVGVANGSLPTNCDVLVINYDVLKKLPADAHFDLLIVDEAHYVKNPKSARTKAVQALARRADRVVFLTGTPILNKPIELWPVLQCVAPEVWDPAGAVKGVPKAAGEGAGFFRFARRYCNAYQEWVTRSKQVWNFDGASNLDELQEKLRATCMVRRAKADVLRELPPKRRQVIELAYHGEDVDCDDPGGDYETARARTAKIAFEDISRVRHAQSLAKLPAALDHLRDLLESTAKIVVFAHHKDVIAALADRLADFGPVTLTGDTAQADRQAAVDRFQTDPTCRVFVGSLMAAGVGLTLVAASTVVFVELDWVPATLTQAEDRCHRIGQTESVLVQHLVAAGTLDARMAVLVAGKQNVADLALDVEAGGWDVADRPVGETVEARRARKVAEAGLTEERIAAVHADLRRLAAVCDGAVEEDGVGFNGLDTNFGKTLAAQTSLSPAQALAAEKMLRKYARQLGRAS